jgi:hypothetical protein
MRELSNMMDTYKFKVISAPPSTVLPLAGAAHAHTLLEQRAAHGRIILVP